MSRSLQFFNLFDQALFLLLSFHKIMHVLELDDSQTFNDHKFDEDDN